jgi:hypothetical protein
VAAIIVKIPLDPKKGTTVKVVGMQGPGCKQLSEAIERGLGIVHTDVETDDMFQVLEEAQTLYEGE